MTRATFPGGLYSICLPDGSRIVEYPDRIEVNGSRIERPGNGLLAMVARKVHGFIYIAGQENDQQRGTCWLWTPSGWRDLGPTHGVRPAAFGDDSLFIATAGDRYARVQLNSGVTTTHPMQIGSQGIRYVNGSVPVPGDATIFDGTVHEFIDRGDVRCGQGHEHGALVNGRLLEPGNCQFINFERDGDALAVAMVKFLEGQSVLYWLTRSEADALPKPGDPPEVPMPECWFHPNIASKDMVTLFDDPATLAPIEVFQVFVQNVIFDGANQGPNTSAALQANHVYQKLKQAGIPLSIEMGSVKPGDCHAVANLHNLEWAIELVREQKGEVTYVSMDEPLTADKDGCHQGIDLTADATAAFIHKGTALNVKVGWIEAWPHIEFSMQQAFLAKLKARTAVPAFWHLDIDWNRAARDGKNPSNFISEAQSLANAYGIPLGLYINATVDPLMTDAAHHANLLMLAQKIRGLVPNPQRLIVASWAFRSGGIQDLPNNLGTNGLLQTYTQIRGLFGGVAPDPIPIEPDPVEPHKELIDMIAYSPPIPGYRAGEFEPHPDGPEFVAVRKPNSRYLCVTPDGDVEERPNAGEPIAGYRPGAWERFEKKKNALIAERGGGKVFVLSLID